MDVALFNEIVIQALVLTFMLVGLMGLLIPVFPGLAIIWLAAAGYMLYAASNGRMTGWDWFLFALITLLAAVGGVIDNIIIAAKLRETNTPLAFDWHRPGGRAGLQFLSHAFWRAGHHSR